LRLATLGADVALRAGVVSATPRLNRGRPIARSEIKEIQDLDLSAFLFLRDGLPPVRERSPNLSTPGLILIH